MEAEKKLIEENRLLRNGVEVVLKNHGTKGLKDFLILGKSLSKIPQDKPDEFLEHLDDKAMDSAINLINITMKKTYPDFNDEDDAWAMTNSMLILPKVIEMCSPKQNRNENRSDELIDRLNKQVKE